MQTSRLKFACPECGSEEVFYSCTPNCCFNHVCASCGASFEPETRATGKKAREIVPPAPLPESTDPTAGCARCDSTQVFLMPDGRPVCAACGEILVLEIPGG